MLANFLKKHWNSFYSLTLKNETKSNIATYINYNIEYKIKQQLNHEVQKK